MKANLCAGSIFGLPEKADVAAPGEPPLQAPPDWSLVHMQSDNQLFPCAMVV